MIKPQICLALIPRFLHEAGGTTCATELEPCTSAVCGASSSALCMTVMSYQLLVPLKGPSLSLSLSPVVECSPLIRLIVLSSIMCSSIRFQGLALGGLWGVREGARRPLAVSNSRLRINSILNSVTRRGTFIGNSAGVLGSLSTLRSSSCAQIDRSFSSHL
jgi:hypothetical protein